MAIRKLSAIEENVYRKIKNVGRSGKLLCLRSVNLPKNCIDNHNIIKRISEKTKKGHKIIVLFLIQYPEMWNSQKSVYDSFIGDNRFDSRIVAIPKPLGATKMDGRFEEENIAKNFCASQNLTYIDAHLDGKWLDISRLSPDIIFIQRPYDEYLPKEYSMSRLSKKSILCYIPYGYEYVNNIHLDIEYNNNFLNTVFCCFAENDDTFRYIIKRDPIDYKIGLRKIYNVGYPRFDLIKTEIDNKSSRKKVLWTPRWSVTDSNDRSYFFDYFELLMGFFTEHSEMELVIRPHPLMFKNFIEKEVLSEGEVNELKNKVTRLHNTNWDCNEDYLDTFSGADILISDFSSLVIEFFATNKPVIYCGSTSGFNSVGKEMAEGLYMARNGEELISHLEFLSKNENRYFEKNKEIISRVIKREKSIGDAIKKTIVDTYVLQ